VRYRDNELAAHSSLLSSDLKVTPITTPLKSMKLDEIVQQWYADFVEVDQVMLFELVTAANFMDIKSLLDLTCLQVALKIKVRYFSYCGCVW
jgi:hypothetical protein